MAKGTQRYISKELIHFIGRRLSEDDRYKLLIRIIQSGWLTHPPHKPNISGNLAVNTTAQISNNDMYSPEVICFCDIPTEDLSAHVNKYGSFGISFSKDFIVQKGGGPVHYLPRQSKVKTLRIPEPHEINRIIEEKGQEGLYDLVDKGEYFDRMMAEHHNLFGMFSKMIMDNGKTAGVPPEHRHLMELQRFFDFHIFSYFKFFDHTLSDDHKDNYYFEREWRVVGNIQFSLEDIETVYLPEKFGKQFRRDLPEYCSQLIFMEIQQLDGD